MVRTILGVARLPSAMTVTRYLGGFVRSQVEHCAAVCWRVTCVQLRPVPLGTVLDLDSTVFERYGHQEGALNGHNPRKHGRPSHHPLLALLAEAKVICHAWLPSGNTGTARGVEAFLAETLATLPSDYRLYALRADSGFFVTEFLTTLESRGLPYAIAVRMNRLVHRQLVGLTAWRPCGPGLEVAETFYQALRWPRPRRLVVVLERIAERPAARGRQLFEVPGYSFHAVVTSLALPPEAVWRFYNSRAESENRFKLKAAFGARGFCLASFNGTEAAFRLICFLFNLVALFKRDVTGNERPQFQTLRARLLVVGRSWAPGTADRSSASGSPGKRRPPSPRCWPESPPSSGQLWRSWGNSAAAHGCSPSNPWRARRPRPVFPQLQLRLN